MAFNITQINAGNRMQLQVLTGYYHAPKKELDIIKDIPNFKEMNLAQIKAMINKDFSKFGNVDETETLEYIEKNGQMFKFRDGKSDVYTKGGLDYQVVEYLDRQQTQNQKWRLETNSTMDFKAGGKVIVAGQEFLIAKVLTILTTGTRTNKFLAMRTPLGWQRYGNKMIVLM